MSEVLQTTSVGSFPKPEYLTKARAAHSKGTLSDDEIRAIESRDPDLLRSVLGFSPRGLPQLTGIRKGGKKKSGATKGAAKKKTGRKPARKRKSSR